MQRKLTVSVGTPWETLTDARTFVFAETVSEQHHEPSDVGRASAHDDVSHRELLEVRQQVIERSVPLVDDIQEQETPDRKKGSLISRRKNDGVDLGVLVGLVFAYHWKHRCCMLGQYGGPGCTRLTVSMLLVSVFIRS